MQASLLKLKARKYSILSKHHLLNAQFAWNISQKIVKLYSLNVTIIMCTMPNVCKHLLMSRLHRGFSPSAHFVNSILGLEILSEKEKSIMQIFKAVSIYSDMLNLSLNITNLIPN